MLKHLIVKYSSMGKSVQDMLDLLIQHKVSFSFHIYQQSIAAQGVYYTLCIGMGHKCNWYNIFTSSKDGLSVGGSEVPLY